jgi:hypothetical protein
MDAATEAKTAVEESQRESRRQREESGEEYVPRFFFQNKDGRWIPKFTYAFFLTSFSSLNYQPPFCTVCHLILSPQSRPCRSGSGHQSRTDHNEHTHPALHHLLPTIIQKRGPPSRHTAIRHDFFLLPRSWNTVGYDRNMCRVCTKNSGRLPLVFLFLCAPISCYPLTLCVFGTVN